LPDLLWALAGLGAVSAPLAAGFATTLVRRRQWRAARAAGCTAPEYQLSPTIEDAERRMAVLLRRMRAHLRDPYDFTVSRIAGEAAFEDCLDRAAALGSCIAELGGAAPASPAERERTRGLILEGLMTSHRLAATRTIPTAGDSRTSGMTRHTPSAGARTHRKSRS
jgi:hypothetical protein